MEQDTQKKYQPGRHVVGPLPEQKDLIEAIETVCRQNAIVRATFSISGSVSSAMIGVFDQVQEVHVTHLENNATELLLCQGTFAATGAKPNVRAKIILADQQGQLTGGHLFSDTIIHDADIDLQELL
jgi:predicted DNA-binding protein with PD1-like motif